MRHFKVLASTAFAFFQLSAERRLVELELAVKAPSLGPAAPLLGIVRCVILYLCTDRKAEVQVGIIGSARAGIPGSRKSPCFRFPGFCSRTGVVESFDGYRYLPLPSGPWALCQHMQFSDLFSPLLQLHFFVLAIAPAVLPGMCIISEPPTEALEFGLSYQAPCFCYY